MKQYKYILVLLFVVIGIYTAKAQVTIGSMLPPAKGMLLELKDSEGGDASEIRNTAKKGGLVLPKVKLIGGKSLMPFIDDSDLAGETDEHIGLVVYNVNEDIDLCPGMYVWNGVEWLFLRVSEFSVELFTDNRDQEIYTYRSFGLAGYWMTENLRSKKYTDNTAITTGIKNINEDATNLKHGMLYTWETATHGKVSTEDEGNIVTTTTQGICPQGWHLPSDLEWNQLEEYVANDRFGTFSKELYIAANWSNTWETSTTSRGTHGVSFKSTDPINSIASNGKSKSKGCSGFNGLLVGSVNTGGAVAQFGSSVSYWTNSSRNSSDAWIRTLKASDSGIVREAKTRTEHFAVRCKKD